MDSQDFFANLTGDASQLLSTATTFGAGAIASAISGNPYYSSDPAAAGYATSGPASQTRGVVSVTAGTNGSIGMLVLLYIAYKLFAK